MATLIMLAFGFVRVDSPQTPIAAREKFYTNPFWLIVFATVEELFARAFLIGWLEHRIGLIAAFLASSVNFTVLHISNGKVTVVNSTNLFLSAILFGNIYMKFGLFAAIGAHYVWNLMQWTVLGFPFYSRPVGRLLQIFPEGVEWQSGGQSGPEYSVVTSVLFYCGNWSTLPHMHSHT